MVDDAARNGPPLRPWRQGAAISVTTAAVVSTRSKPSRAPYRCPRGTDRLSRTGPGTDPATTISGRVRSPNVMVRSGIGPEIRSGSRRAASDKAAGTARRSAMVSWSLRSNKTEATGTQDPAESAGGGSRSQAPVEPRRLQPVSQSALRAWTDGDPPSGGTDVVSRHAPSARPRLPMPIPTHRAGVAGPESRTGRRLSDRFGRR